MKKEKILTATIPSIVAVVAIVLSVRLPISPDRIAGFVTVLMLLGIAALEYRVTWKNLFNR